jgi:hypothetical protein
VPPILREMAAKSNPEKLQQALAKARAIIAERKVPACRHEHLDMDGVCHACGLGGAPAQL